MGDKPFNLFTPAWEGDAIIRIVRHAKNGSYRNRSDEGIFVAVRHGCMTLAASGFSMRVPSGNLVFIPPGVHYEAVFHADTCLVLFSLERHVDFCEHFLSVEQDGYRACKQVDTPPPFTTLALDGRMWIFMDSVLAYCGMDRVDARLFDLKVEELFYLMGITCSRDELESFFSPLLGSDASFTYFVLKNHDKARSVTELAERYNLGLSSFEKEFRRVFGDSPYRWMKRKKADRLLERIRHSGRQFKEISEEFGFSSITQLSDFCRRELGLPPGKLRNGGKTAKTKKTLPGGNRE